jgi:hypothetical protein
MFEPVADRSIQLTDGRTLAFTEWGDLDGPPVVFFTARPDRGLFCPDIAATQATGVHLVILGPTGLRPIGCTAGHADDARLDRRRDQLADALDLDRFGVIGWSSGAT